MKKRRQSAADRKITKDLLDLLNYLLFKHRNVPYIHAIFQTPEQVRKNMGMP